jgi:hypothetical protein
MHHPRCCFNVWSLIFRIPHSHFRILYIPYALCAMPYAGGMLTADLPAAENLTPETRHLKP